VRLVEVVGYEADEARISHSYKWERFNNRGASITACSFLAISSQQKHNIIGRGLNGSN
jgi:hypothetical protein